MRMRGKLVVQAAVLLIAVFAMSANAFCAGICAGGHGHDAGAVSADKNGHEAHSCHHYAPLQAKAAPRHHDGHEKTEPQACHAKGHEDEVQPVSAKSIKPDKSFPVIECNCMDDPGAFAPETEAPVTLGMQPAPALDFAAVAATAEARIVLAEFMPSETPPRNHAPTF